MTAKVLVTGALGYLGGRISHYLSEQEGLEVILGIRDMNRPIPKELTSCRAVRIDLDDDRLLTAACENVSAVVHLAALNEIDSAANPEQALIVNGIGSLKLLRAAEKSGVERFIYFSTAHVYGAPLEGVITESTLARPVHPYAITHRTAEDFVLAAHDRNALSGVVVRLSNGFGAPLTPDVNRWSLVVNDLCRQSVETGKMKLQSAGLQHRDFITLHDMARGVHHLLSLTPVEYGNGLFNLGGELPLRILDLAERIAERCNIVLGFAPPLLRPEPKPGEVANDLDYRIDRMKATGFQLCGNIDDEIDATLRLCSESFGKSSP